MRELICRVSDLSQGRRISRLDGAEAPRSINNVVSVKVLAPSTLPWRFLDKRSCVNQTASFCRAGFWVWFELVSLVPLLGSSGVCLITMHDDSCFKGKLTAIVSMKCTQQPEHTVCGRLHE